MKEPLETVTGAGHRLGEYIRDQRRGSQISLRQLATRAGVSNPYLSQIERGLRKPSAEILQQIAKGLRISAEALYLQAGILEHRDGERAVVDAVLSDELLSERQKQVLLEIYDSFCKENTGAAPAPARFAPPAPTAVPAPEPAPPARRTRAPRKRVGSAPPGTSATSSAAPSSAPPSTPTDPPTLPQEATS